MNVKRERWQIVIAGLMIGVIASLLVYFGNPSNMGFCIACFLRDTAGGLGLHRAAAVQYIRPEIVGLVLGSFIVALCRKEFSAKGGSAPVTRFVLGFFVMIGCLMFLGCPFRMILRLAGGEARLLPEAHLPPDQAGRLPVPRHSGNRVHPAGGGSRLHFLHRSRRRPRRQARPYPRQPCRRSHCGRSGPAHPSVHGGRHP